MEYSPEKYDAPQLRTFHLLVEEGFARSAGGSIDDMPVIDWSTPSPFQYHDDETF